MAKRVPKYVDHIHNIWDNTAYRTGSVVSGGLNGKIYDFRRVDKRKTGYSWKVIGVHKPRKR
jgi:hypothetical protein